MKFKAAAAVLAATMMLGTGSVTAMAAETGVQTLSEAEVRAEVESFLETPEVRAEIEAYASEAETTPAAFNMNGLKSGETGDLEEMAYALDLDGESMAKGSLAGGSTVKLTDGGYEFTIYGKSMTEGFMDQLFSADVKSVDVTYYDQNGEKVTIAADTKKEEVEGETLTRITFTIPADAQGMEPTSAASGYDNMIKVAMTTTLEDEWIGPLLPPSMKNPTFFYAFNVK